MSMMPLLSVAGLAKVIPHKVRGVRSTERGRKCSGRCRSRSDAEREKLAYLQVERGYKNLLSNISQLKSSLIDNERSRNGTKISGTKEEVNLEVGRCNTSIN